MNKLLSWFCIFVYTLTFFLISFTLSIQPAEADCFLFWCNDNKSSFRNQGGVNRGPCVGEDFSLIALVPETNPESSVGEYLTTIEEYPTFWFYIPAYKSAPDPIKRAKFALLDQENHLVKDRDWKNHLGQNLHNPVYVELPEISHTASGAMPKGGAAIAGLTLPKTLKALEIGQQYTWRFSILCDRSKPSRNPEVIGKIKRVLPQVPPRITERNYIVHDSTYNYHNREGNKIVWYDTINQLVNQHSIYEFDWKDLLSKTEIPKDSPVVNLPPIDSQEDNQQCKI